MKVQLAQTGKKDERLEFVMAQTKSAVETFTEAIKKSSDEQQAVSFKAFTLKADRTESDKVFDVIMSIVAMELHQQAEKMIKEYTFFHSVEAFVENGTEVGFSLLLHCDKTRKPPTKEEVEEALKAEEEKVEAEELPPLTSEENVVVEPLPPLQEVDSEVIPHASGIEYWKRPGGE
jgi:hypothetical protein